MFQVGSDNICDLVREHEALDFAHKAGSDLRNLPFKELQVLVRAVNKGKGTRSRADGEKILIDYVKKHCACV